jgi:creatinine amidohydrolase
MRKSLAVLAVLLLYVAPSWPQARLSVHWEELTADDFRSAIEQAKGTCLLPFGILEKHGQHLPLGTDLLKVRYVVLRAAEQEYAVVFPEYYFGQIFEARHEPGTVAYSTHLQLDLLQETTNEMARNGCKKIIIVNGHGGNENLLPFFAQTQMEKPADAVVCVMPIVELWRPPEEDRGGSARWRVGDFEDADRDSESCAHGPGKTGVWRGSGTAEAAGYSLHRDLVVCPLPQSLFRGRIGCDS